jgi:hypothetical protein
MTYLKRHVEAHEGRRCLFCGDGVPAVWSYATYTTNGLTWHWNTCDECSRLVEAEKLSPLVNRYVYSHQTKLNPAVLKPLVEMILKEFHDESISGVLQ